MIVEAPISLWLLKVANILDIAALIMAMKYIPEWEKKFLSSEDKKALINCFGILSIGMKILSSLWYDFNKTPSEL